MAPKLGAQTRKIITDPDHDIGVSALSVWEAAIKRPLGELRFDTIHRGVLRILPITAEHALAAGDLPRHHDDPFDRMLVAQAIGQGLTIITRDVRLRPYDVATIEAWAAKALGRVRA